MNYFSTQEFEKSHQENKIFSVLLSHGYSLGKMWNVHWNNYFHTSKTTALLLMVTHLCILTQEFEKSHQENKNFSVLLNHG